VTLRAQPMTPPVEGARYFAVTDPLDPAKVSYWYRPTEGRHAGAITPWPLRRNSWGALYRKDVAAGADGRAYAIEHFARVARARQDAEREIDRDPVAAAQRFARLAIRCCCCGKALTDDRSKVYGIGPECRRGASPAFLALLVEQVKAAYGGTASTSDRAGRA